MQKLHTTLQLGMIIRRRYVVEGVLGQRSFGAVYLVRDQRNNQKLFVLREVPKPGWKDRYQAFFKSNASRHPDHPALSHVYGVFNDNKLDRAFMLMDYIEGPNLEILRQGQPEQRFSLHEVMTLIAPVMGAVSHLHSQHHPITHGNIKPSNIIMRKEGAGTALVGFSIVHKSGTDPTPPFDRHVTSGCQAPEQYSRGADPRTDIYALGAVLYTLLTGSVPADALYRLAQLGEREPDPLLPVNQITPGIPATIAGAIHCAMSIHRNDRFSSVEQFWNSLWQAPNIYPIAQPTWVPGEQPRIKEDNELDANPTLEDTPGPMVPPPPEESKEPEEVEKPASESLQKQPQSHQFKKPGNTFFIPLK